jgi:cyclophilin family peptidyl-prolyl cis-trans isomerase
MPDPKRERQRQNRDAARQAQLEAARQAKRKQSGIRLAIVAVAAIAVAVLAAALFGGKDDKKKVEATNSTSTTAGVTTTTVDQAALAKVECNDKQPAENPNRPTFKEAPPMTIDAAKKYTATIDTSCGKITVELDPKAAPKTVNNFVFLANQKFFDGLTWHRVVKDFVIQGGDPQGSGSGGPGYEFEDELPQGTNVYVPGVLAMANSGPNTNGSQFFIVTGNGGLNLQNKYNLFGKVTDGLIVAQKLESFNTGDGPPSRKLYIVSITVKEG